jgi:hypothetical protein
VSPFVTDGKRYVLCNKEMQEKEAIYLSGYCMSSMLKQTGKTFSNQHLGIRVYTKLVMAMELE